MSHCTMSFASAASTCSVSLARRASSYERPLASVSTASSSTYLPAGHVARRRSRGAACSSKVRCTRRWRRFPTESRRLRHSCLHRGGLARRARQALHWGLVELEPEIESTTSAAMLSMLARVAYEAGRRELAVAVLRKLLAAAGGGAIRITEPCRPASARFDALTVVGDVTGFIVAAAVEAMASWHSFSAYFSDDSTVDILNGLQLTPYASAPMERRRQLQLIKMGCASAVTAHPLLARAAPNHLNVEFWTRAAAERTAAPSAL